MEFQISQKIQVNGSGACDLYKFLKYNSSLKNDNQVKDIPWNFAKFLVSGDGTQIKYFDSRIEPRKIESHIKEYLKWDPIRRK